MKKTGKECSRALLAGLLALSLGTLQISPVFAAEPDEDTIVLSDDPDEETLEEEVADEDWAEDETEPEAAGSAVTAQFSDRENLYLKKADILKGGTIAEKLRQLEAQFPGGRFWNHAAGAEHVILKKTSQENGQTQYLSDPDDPCNAPDETTDHPCTTHTNSGGRQDEFECQTGDYTCNLFGGGLRCSGFANLLFYKLFGEEADTRRLTVPSSVDDIRIGDWVQLGTRTQLGYHHAIVRSVDYDEGTITIGEANYAEPCKIVWGHTYSFGDIQYYKRASNWDTVNRNRTYTIAYEGGADDVQGSMPSLLCYYGLKNTTAPNAFTREGYLFDCWYARKADGSWIKEKDGSLKRYADGCQVWTTTSTDQETVTFVAQWLPREDSLVIAYDSGSEDAKGTMPGLHLKAGQTSLSPMKNAFTRDNYLFAGWNLQNTDTGQWAAYTSAGELVWVSDKEQAASQGYTLVNLKAGESFELDRGLGTHWSLQATWQLKSFAIQYEAGSAEAQGSMRPETLSTTRALEAPASRFSRTQYEFAGWKVYSEDSQQWLAEKGSELKGFASEKEAKNAGFTPLLLQAGDRVNLPASLGASWKLVAQWQKKALPFSDVAQNTWYCDWVEQANELGLMTGLRPGTFGPDEPMTRAMAVMVLYRLAGSPAVKADSQPFPDVKSGQWYTQAIVWAKQTGVAGGYDTGYFGPDDAISREQLCKMMRGFMASRGVDTSTNQSLAAFPDGNKVSGFARSAMQYCVQAGIISGHDSGHLAPQNTATRAECAKILVGVHKKLAEKQK